MADTSKQASAVTAAAGVLQGKTGAALQEGIATLTNARNTYLSALMKNGMSQSQASKLVDSATGGSLQSVLDKAMGQVTYTNPKTGQSVTTSSNMSQQFYDTQIKPLSDSGYKVTSGSVSISPVPPQPMFPGTGSGSSGEGSNTGNASTAVKVAGSNLFVLDETALSIESMTDLVFEDIGGQELIDITRADLAYNIQTQVAANQPIKNLDTITGNNSPKSLVGLQDSSYTYSSFAINLADYIPQSPQGTVTENNQSVIDNSSHVYIERNLNSTNLDSIVIEIVNINPNNYERVEVEILSYEDAYSGII
jgi:hypothetical protein